MVNEGVSQSAADMQAELQRLRGEVAVLRRAVAGSGDGGGKGTDDSGGKGSSGAEGTQAGADLAAALGVNAELEAQLAAVQEQMGRLRRERDAHEAAAAAAHAQQQILEEAEGAAEARAAGLAAECQRLQVACAERESEAETLQGRLAGLEASEAAARERLEAAAGAAAQQATALEQAEGELEVARGQLRARSASRSSGKGKENRQGRWVGRGGARAMWGMQASTRAAASGYSSMPAHPAHPCRLTLHPAARRSCWTKLAGWRPWCRRCRATSSVSWCAAAALPPRLLAAAASARCRALAVPVPARQLALQPLLACHC